MWGDLCVMKAAQRLMKVCQSLFSSFNIYIFIFLESNDLVFVSHVEVVWRSKCCLLVVNNLLLLWFIHDALVIDKVNINVCTHLMRRLVNVTFTFLSFRYPPRLGCCTNTPPPRARLCLSSHGQPESVCSPPVLPPADHVGLPVWSRSAQHAYITLIQPSFENRLKYSTILFVDVELFFFLSSVFFAPQSQYSVVSSATLCTDHKSCSAKMFFFSFNKSSEPDGLLATK